MITAILIGAGIVYVAGFIFTFATLSTAFPLSKLQELILPSLAWPVILPIIIIGLGN
jgi:hypothetical protein